MANHVYQALQPAVLFLFFPPVQTVISAAILMLLPAYHDTCNTNSFLTTSSSLPWCVYLHIVFRLTSFSPEHKRVAGPGDLPGLTDDDKPRMRGPKRASKIRKLFNLTKDDDVRKYVNTYRRSFEGKDGKTHSKAPKIQRLVTPLTLQRKRRRASLNRQRHEKVRLCLTAHQAAR